MSIIVPGQDDSTDEKPEYMKQKGIYVPPGGGDSRWVVGDTYSLKVGGPQTNGALSFLEATVPPGAGAHPHIHSKHQEAFYILSGELEFVNGDGKFLAGSGSFYYVPDNTRHSFFNKGLHAVKMIFLFLPGGYEEILFSGAPKAEPGVPVPDKMENLPNIEAELMDRFGTFILPEDLPESE